MERVIMAQIRGVFEAVERTCIIKKRRRFPPQMSIQAKHVEIQIGFI